MVEEKFNCVRKLRVAVIRIAKVHLSVFSPNQYVVCTSTSIDQLINGLGSAAFKKYFSPPIFRGGFDRTYHIKYHPLKRTYYSVDSGPCRTSDLLTADTVQH